MLERDENIDDSDIFITIITDDIVSFPKIL